MTVAIRTISCEECGQPYETVRTNTKFCDICRLLKDVEFHATKTRACWVCEEDFAPIDNKSVGCAKHSYHPAKHGVNKCAICSKEELRIRANVAVCVYCAHDPLRRQSFIKGLYKRRAARQQMTKDGVIDA